MYPEYTGVILSELAHQTKRPSDANAAYDAAKAFEEKRGFTLLDKTPFFDSDALAVKPDYASKYKLKTVADFKNVGQKIKGPAKAHRTAPGISPSHGVIPQMRYSRAVI